MVMLAGADVFSGTSLSNLGRIVALMSETLNHAKIFRFEQRHQKIGFPAGHDIVLRSGARAQIRRRVGSAGESDVETALCRER